MVRGVQNPYELSHSKERTHAESGHVSLVFWWPDHAMDGRFEPPRRRKRENIGGLSRSWRREVERSQQGSTALVKHSTAHVDDDAVRDIRNMFPFAIARQNLQSAAEVLRSVSKGRVEQAAKCSLTPARSAQTTR